MYSIASATGLLRAKRLTFLPQPLLERLDERAGELVARGEPLLGAPAVARALQLEDRIDPPHRLCRDRRDDRRTLAPLELGGDVGQLEELAA
jgi:hypothetical protein